MMAKRFPAGAILTLLGGIAGSFYCLSNMVAETTAPRTGIVSRVLSLEPPVFEPLLAVSVLLATIATVRLLRREMRES
jgi:hypothetical protein